MQIEPGTPTDASDPDLGPVERLPLPDADLQLFHQLPLGASTTDLFQALQAETPWREESITLFGKTYLQPRLMAWYGDPDAHYRYSGKTYAPLPWTNLLLKLRDRMQQLAEAPLNSVLLNYYRDGRDSMGLHADDEPELGPAPVIASLSLGEARKLYFRHKRERGREGLDVTLTDGSVLLMRGATQANWKHGIRKLARPCGPRINLTFRQVQHGQA
ncbi:alpha-ketoglutarate-dependent dioxygenase AlkB [Mangrovimicrobium sediminis]|uniref:Alpha-ketoglutarate-dependent dioxygenase AlkB n=1 Tax=Mangrovimicrobium sediminis TaxID=2562682 RepID=A0A4Z0LZA5_9GAMM|nr:alpha-ketoglutarate-dependent dioxygenase AlkB [Haliea sp. SAOS-164]TGD72516.1 alpha-ketoglutarate-dependent dioxygenase AlkB [Haliea sp. SAOS-164]